MKKTDPPSGQAGAKDPRKDALGKALRANLARRKKQAKARKAEVKDSR